MSDEVYFMRRPNSTGPIKIGVTTSLARRLYQISREIGDDLEIIASMDGGIKIEKAFHQRHKASCIGGEWFSPSADLIDDINEIRSGNFDFSFLPKKPQKKDYSFVDPRKSIRQFLLRKTFTKKALANEAGVHQNSLTGIETDEWNPTLNTVANLLEAVKRLEKAFDG